MGSSTTTRGGAAAPAPEAAQPQKSRWLLLYLLLGIAFGFTLTKAEVISWFRIQEMFRFQSFHMYGVFAAALAVATPAFWLIRRSGLHSMTGEPIVVPDKVWGKGIRYVAGGLCFGVGWALTGACPGPLFALVGAGATAMVVALGSALLGTWVYAWLRPTLPH